MARQKMIRTIGIPLDQNLLKPAVENGLDKYFISEVEEDNIAGNIGVAQATANTALATANTALSNANIAQSTANNAQSAADTALVNAATAQTAANTAQTTANAAAASATLSAGYLAGCNNNFKGTAVTSINGTPSSLVLDSFTNVTAENISMTAGGYFEFGHLGDYLVSVKLTGAIANSRTDWYQVVQADVYNAVDGETIIVYTKTIPPSMTLGIHSAVPSVLVKVKQGDQWKVRVSAVANGVISSGVAVVSWVKVV